MTEDPKDISKCKSCGVLLPDGHSGPCPSCGGKNKVLSVHAAEHVVFSDTVELEVWRRLYPKFTALLVAMKLGALLAIFAPPSGHFLGVVMWIVEWLLEWLVNKLSKRGVRVRIA